MEHLIIAAVIFLVLFAALAALDGLYFHLWKYRLYARPESVYEHKLHTVRAFLFIPIVFFLFYENYAGIVIWAGVIFILIDLVVEMMDVFDEKQSRASIGGLSSLEYAVHVAVTTLRIAAITLVLAAKPLSSWNLSNSLIVEPVYPAWIGSIACNVIAGNLFVGLLHVWLLRGKYFVSDKALPIRNCCAFES